MTDFENEDFVQDNQMMSVTQIAKLLNISLGTIRKWMDQGRISYFKVERTNRFLRKDVEKFLKENYYPKQEETEED